jgi:hypothetical protein
MPSLSRIDANRANAQHSTGPRTPEGKARASRNAIRHGLLASQLVLSVEDRAEFEMFRAGLVEEYRPAGTQELMLVSQIADSFWRLRRAKSIETAMFERYLDAESASPSMTLAHVWEAQSQHFDRLRRYIAGFERAYYRAIATLRQIQKDRRKQDESFAAASPEPPVGFVSHPLQTADSAVPSSSPRPSSPQRLKDQGIESA